MKKIALLIALLATAGITNAQQLKTDGTIVDSHNSTIGYLKNDGTVEDSHHSTVGYIKRDGTIEDSHHSTIGYLKPGGVMEDSHHSTIGKTTDNKMESVIKQFFFKK